MSPLFVGNTVRHPDRLRDLRSAEAWFSHCGVLSSRPPVPRCTPGTRWQPLDPGAAAHNDTRQIGYKSPGSLPWVRENSENLVL